MLQMLNSGRTIKISEFAEEFETNPRNIIEYRKEELEKMGAFGYDIFIVDKDGNETNFFRDGCCIACCHPFYPMYCFCDFRTAGDCSGRADRADIV